VTERADQLTQGVATALTDLAARIDGRLADVQSSVQVLQSDITALQERVQALQSRLLLTYNLIALAATLLYLWVIYSQIVVIRHHWSRSKSPAPQKANVELSSATAAPDQSVERSGSQAKPPTEN
jgi:hypothetical protein